MLAFHAGGVLAAAFHFGNGLVALAGPWGMDWGPRGRVLAERLGAASFVVVSIVGLHALLAFVVPGLRWLAPHD
jgi:succinate dehydrogenase / fumarate reductase cytochrome b subunit